MKPVRTAAVCAAALCTSAVSFAESPRNVILMISDGAGPTTWLAANQWQFGPSADSAPQFRQRYEQDDFVRLWMTTYPDNTQPLPPGLTDVLLGLPAGSLPRYLPQLWNELPIPNQGSYDPVAANDLTPAQVRIFASDTLLLDRGPLLPLTPVPTNSPTLQFLANALAADGTVISTVDQGFAAYDYLIWNGTTDSAAAGTALASGFKTYNSGINVIDNGTDLVPVPFITQKADAAGLATGIVTTKPFTDATPAAFGTQNIFRDNEADISNDMISNGLLDVIITPGHPEFGSGGAPRIDPDYSTISQANLDALRHNFDNWTLIENASTLQNIAAGVVSPPQRLFGLLPVGSQLNSRDTTGRTNAYDPRVFDPASPNGAVPFVMPDLPELSIAAINTLSQDPDGFFLMIENASVDSGAHANDLPRIIEEQLAFNRAVDAVIDWVDNNSSWDETLLIVTTDHANALFLGPGSDTVPFQSPVAGQPGELPTGIFWSTNHTNELVPLFAKGVNAEYLSRLIDRVDPVRGAYVDNTDVFTVMSVTVQPAACPDADSDGKTGTSDLLILLANWGSPTAVGPSSGDFDGDGQVGTNDLLTLLVGFGTACP